MRYGTNRCVKQKGKRCEWTVRGKIKSTVVLVHVDGEFANGPIANTDVSAVALSFFQRLMRFMEDGPCAAAGDLRGDTSLPREIREGVARRMSLTAYWVYPSRKMSEL